MKTTKIVIAGGGFAGLGAAMYLDRTLAGRAEADVTLISHQNFILFTPMLHEVAAGDLYPGDIVNPLRRILRHVKFIQADVQAIDLSVRRVRCFGGIETVEFEALSNLAGRIRARAKQSAPTPAKSALDTSPQPAITR